MTSPKQSYGSPYTTSGNMKRTARRQRIRLAAASAAAAVLLGTAAAEVPPGTARGGPIHLRVVGGLAGVNQYTRREQPFWTQALPAQTRGRVTAEIVPFDQAGLRGQEVLRLMSLGIVPFGTVILGTNSSSDPEFGAADLAGLSSNIQAARRVIEAFRPHLKQALRDRYGVELLAVYAYPGQMLFCQEPFAGLKDLQGRRIRTAQPSASDFVEALNAVPVRVAFADIVSNVRSGNLDCAITGSMSGYTVGLDQVTTHLYSMPFTWGVSIFAANTEAWVALPRDVRSLLSEQLQRLETDIWADAEKDTIEGVNCSVGNSKCPKPYRKGTMVEVKPNVDDERLRQKIFVSTVLPRWIERCGANCADVWNKTLQRTTGVEASAR
jgi:TRAP-type C4-dicarboxylate transport system substrate-binding protein